MTRQPSTIRISAQPTVEDPFVAADEIDVTARIVRFWKDDADGDLLRTWQAFPSLASHRSLLLDLAVEDYRTKCKISGADPHAYCEQFRALGKDFEHSIIRAIEVQEYLNKHPELLELVTDYRWPDVGDKLQGFEVIEELGRGALARAYLCKESGLAEREVVVKVSRGGGYEAALLARLNHPNIVPVYSVSNDGNQFVSYICMPYRGRCTLQDLADRIATVVPQRGQAILNVARSCHKESQGNIHKVAVSRTSYVDSIVRLACSLADALTHAHETGVLHGDLKPSNVLLTEIGEPLLIDFNLARDNRTESVPRGGTLAYMPPELLQAVVSESRAGDTAYDVRSEVYSFGALLFQLLTGRVPFEVDATSSNAIDAAEDLLHKQSGSISRIRDLNPDVNSSLERLVTDCLSIDPANRPQSMAEVTRRLRLQTSWLPWAARQLSIWRPQAIAVAALAVCLSVAVFTYLLFRPPYSERQFDLGVSLYDEGDFSQAAVSFGRAWEDASLRRESLLWRARSYLSNNESLLAIKDFERLAEAYDDSRGYAGVGYCFNRRGENDAAIHWYENALANGFDSAELRNNLGISYAICKSHVGHIERFDRAFEHLTRAIELDSQFLAARFNLMAAAQHRSAPLPTRDAGRIADNIDVLIRFLPGDKVVLRSAVPVYGEIAAADEQYLNRCVDVCRLALESGAGPTRVELRLNPAYAALRQHPEFGPLYERASDSAPVGLGTRPDPFVDPFEKSAHLSIRK